MPDRPGLLPLPPHGIFRGEVARKVCGVRGCREQVRVHAPAQHRGEGQAQIMADGALGHEHRGHDELDEGLPLEVPDDRSARPPDRLDLGPRGEELDARTGQECDDLFNQWAIFRDVPLELGSGGRDGDHLGIELGRVAAGAPSRRSSSRWR